MSPRPTPSRPAGLLTTRRAAEVSALKFRHAGQACITANRVYVQKGVYDKFSGIMADSARKLKVGHGMAKDTTMGPVTTPRGLDKAEQLLADAKKGGGNVLLGGRRVQISGGYFFEPTIVTGATEDMQLAREEQFSPILALFPFDTEEEVVELANRTSVRRGPRRALPAAGVATGCADGSADGPGVVLLHQERRPHVAAARESRGRHDRDEHR